MKGKPPCYFGRFLTTFGYCCGFRLFEKCIFFLSGRELIGDGFIVVVRAVAIIVVVVVVRALIIICICLEDK